MKNIALIGLGPHAKRIYMKYIKEKELNLILIVELKEKEDEVNNYIKENNLNNTKLYLLDNKSSNNIHLPLRTEKELKYIFLKNKITHMIISTEPKAHNMYLEFALKNNIDVLTDKPIIVLKGMDKLKNIDKMRKMYYDLLDLQEKSKANCKVMCQRACHRGYIYVKEILKETIEKYNIPITYIDIYHCDGNWEMPHDLLKENHPYKYGYGKLYHSGFHFIDLLSQFLELNKLVSKEKQIEKGELSSQVFTPNDEKIIFNKEDYFNIFKESKNNELYNNLDKTNYNDFGEKNFYGQFNFYNKDDALITTANLNLLHYGFSRRGWFESRDYYKKNGRVRHERVTINVGPLMCIQITSYQSKEIKDRTNKKQEIMEGGLEHFDIDIYRNIDIIGGKAHEKIKLYDLYKDININKSFIGYNEKSREEFLNNFFNKESDLGNLEQEKQAIEILYSCSKAIYNRYNKIKSSTSVNIIKNSNNINLIKKITDKDLNIKEKEIINPKRRTASRGILENKQGKIAIIYKSKMNEYKLPGGGIDDNEDKEVAFRREILEETGCIIKELEELGITIEEESQTNFIQKSYIFKSKVYKDTKKLHLTEREEEEGAKILWLDPQDALNKIKESYNNVLESRYENNYNSKFIILRDISIIEYYLKSK